MYKETDYKYQNKCQGFVKYTTLESVNKVILKVSRFCISEGVHSGIKFSVLYYT